MSIEDTISQLLEAYRRNLQRTDDHVEGGMHLDKELASGFIIQAFKDEGWTKVYPSTKTTGSDKPHKITVKVIQ